MTNKKRFTIQGIYFVVFLLCLFLFKNGTLNFFLILIGTVLSALLKGYAQDYKNQHNQD